VIKDCVLKAGDPLTHISWRHLEQNWAEASCLPPAFLVQENLSVGQVFIPDDKSPDTALWFYNKSRIAFDCFSYPAKLERSDQT